MAIAKVNTQNFKTNIRKAREVVLANCLDLSQLQNSKIGAEFLVREGVKIGLPTDLSVK